MARVLLIDDNRAIRQTVGDLLGALGHDVVTAADGEQGLNAFAARSPDVVITDILMPGREGLETIMALREADPDLPIIAISGGGANASLNFLQHARLLGADEILRKPFTLDALEAALDAVMERNVVPLRHA